MTARVLTAVVLIPLVLAAIFVFPLWVFLILVTVTGILGLREFQHLLEKSGLCLFPESYPLLAVAPWIASYYPRWLIPLLPLVLLILAFSLLVQVRDVQKGLLTLGGNLLALAYIGIPISLTGLLHPQATTPLPGVGEQHHLLVVLLIVWVSDSAAYFVGRAVGKHKVLTHLSPKKSLEGFIAGIAVPTVLLPLAGSILLPGKPPGFLVLTALVVSIAGESGDLLESMFKRGANVKDTSQLLPGHGGVLDRIDSLLIAVPAYFLLVILLESPTLV
jgi:phosphatidate cytidylyltransferase